MTPDMSPHEGARIIEERHARRRDELAKAKAEAVRQAAYALHDRAAQQAGESPGWKRGQREAYEFLTDVADDIEEGVR